MSHQRANIEYIGKIEANMSRDKQNVMGDERAIARGSFEHAKAEKNAERGDDATPKSLKRRERKKRSLIRRLLRGLFLLILLLIITILGISTYLIYSPKGLEQMVAQLNRYLPGYVSIERSEGRLRDKFTLYNAKITLSPKQTFHFEEVTLDWNPKRLSRRVVDINQLTVKGGEINFDTGEKVEKEKLPKEGPFSLSEIKLPLKLLVDRLDIESVHATIDETMEIEVDHLIADKLHADHKGFDFEDIALEGRYLQPDLSLPLLASLKGEGSFEENTLDLHLKAVSSPITLKEDQFDFDLTLDANGDLNDLALVLESDLVAQNYLLEPLHLVATAEVKEQRAVESHLALTSANNRLTLQGGWSADEPSALNLDLLLDATELEKIHPDVHGDLGGSLSLRGTLLQPLIESDLAIDHLEALGLKLERLTLNAHHNGKEMEETLLDAKNLQIGEMTIDQIALNAVGDINSALKSTLSVKRIHNSGGVLLDHAEMIFDGSFAGHTFNFDAESPFASLTLSGIARLAELDRSPKWTLYLEESTFNSKYTGRYQLQKPTYLFASKDEVSLSSFCLVQLPTSLCLEGRYQPEMSAGTAVLRRLPASIVKEFLPPDLLIDTSLDLVVSGRFTDKEDYVGVADLSLAEGRTRYRLQGRQVEIPLTASFMRLLAKPEDVTADLGVDWGQYLQIKGSGKLLDPFEEQQLQFHTEAHIPSLTWISPLVPYLQKLEGRVNARADIHGPMKKPTLYANIGFNDGNIYIGELNTSIRNINLNAILKEGLPELAITGRTDLGEGRLNVTGDFNIERLTAHITAKGDNLLFADSPNIRLLASPDLRYTLEGGRQSVTGSIFVPELKYIHANYGQGRGKVKAGSSDVIIVRGAKPKQKAPIAEALELDLAVRLGEKISVGMGSFLGYLKGELHLKKSANSEIEALGGIDVKSGEYRLYGQRLNLDRGQVRFSGPLLNPLLDIQASREFDLGKSSRKGDVGIRLTGNLRRPKITLYSNPMMSDLAIVSYLIFGREPNLNSPADSAFLAKALIDILAGKDPGGGGLADQFGLTDFGLTQDLAGNTAVGLGKQVNDQVYVGLGMSLEEGSNAYGIIRYKFLNYFNFETQVGSEDSSVDLLYTRDF